MRACQTEGITNLEKSFAAAHPRALIQMAIKIPCKTFMGRVLTGKDKVRSAALRNYLFGKKSWKKSLNIHLTFLI
jgi:hypothetical protein